ncbi:MAG: DUF4383 domain-containing protein [Pseudomonadota bacterium]
MLKGFSLLFGIIFILMGIAGFIPPLIHNQLLFHSFSLGPVLNIFYILTGLIGLSTSVSPGSAKSYFKVFGIIYALIAILGFALNGNLGFLQLNLADSFFHLIVAVIALYLGFTSKLTSNR